MYYKSSRKMQNEGIKFVLLRKKHRILIYFPNMNDNVVYLKKVQKVLV